MKLVKRVENFKKDKEIVNYTAFYLDFENGVRVKIKPVYKADHNVLILTAKEYEK